MTNKLFFSPRDFADIHHKTLLETIHTVLRTTFLVPGMSWLYALRISHPVRNLLVIKSEIYSGSASFEISYRMREFLIVLLDHTTRIFSKKQKVLASSPFSSSLVRFQFSLSLLTHMTT